MDREKIGNKQVRQYITISDVSLLKTIEKLSPKYKTLNKLLNDALKKGLPLLLNEKCGNEDIICDVPNRVELLPKEQYGKFEESNLNSNIEELKKLLIRIVINTTITKGMVSGLYNSLGFVYQGKTVNADSFNRGQHNNTPNCLYAKEIRMLKELIGEDDEDEDEEE